MQGQLGVLMEELADLQRSRGDEARRELDRTGPIRLPTLGTIDGYSASLPPDGLAFMVAGTGSFGGMSVKYLTCPILKK